MTLPHFPKMFKSPSRLISTGIRVTWSLKVDEVASSSSWPMSTSTDGPRSAMMTTITMDLDLQ